MEEPYEYGIYCTTCEGQALPLGKLGKLNYYKCRDCGMDFAYEIKEKEKDKNEK